MFQVSKADFSGFPETPTDAPKLFVSGVEVIQKASISVDEEGTEVGGGCCVR